MSKGFALSLDSEAFNGYKQDFNLILKDTIETMQKKGVDKATLTAKFEINLIPGINRHATGPGGEALYFTAPVIKHKVTANMKLQSEAAGTLGGTDWALVWDEEADDFIMVPVTEQASMFDEDFGEDDDL